MDEVRALLAHLNLSVYENKLEDEGYDSIRALRAGTRADFEDIGLKRGHAGLLVQACASSLSSASEAARVQQPPPSYSSSVDSAVADANLSNEGRDERSGGVALE